MKTAAGSKRNPTIAAIKPTVSDKLIQNRRGLRKQLFFLTQAADENLRLSLSPSMQTKPLSFACAHPPRRQENK